MKLAFRMDSRPLLVYAAAAAAFVLAGLVVALATLVPSLLSPLAAAVLAAGLAAIGAAEVGIWLRRGIRSVEVDEDTLTLARGAALRPVRVTRASTRWSPRAVRTVRRFGRRVVVLRPRGARPMRISEDAFGREDFSRLVAVLDSWRLG
jgi:hypothetical protein